MEEVQLERNKWVLVSQGEPDQEKLCWLLEESERVLVRRQKLVWVMEGEELVLEYW